MKCPKFQQENEEGAKFCEEFSAPLQEKRARRASALSAACRATPAFGTKRTSRDVRSLVAIGGKADMAVCTENLNTGVVVMKSAQDGA